MLMCKFEIIAEVANFADLGQQRWCWLQTEAALQKIWVTSASSIHPHRSKRSLSSKEFMNIFNRVDMCNRNLRRWDNRSCFCLDFPKTTQHIYADWTDISANNKMLLFFLDNSSKQYLDLKSLHKSINLHILKLSRNSAARLFSVHIDLWKKSATMVEGPKTFWWD